MNTRRHFKLLLGSLALVGFVGGIYLFSTHQPTAPALTYTDITGEKTTPEKLRNQVYLVNFWATSCPGCVQEMPKLSDLHRRLHQKGFETITVAMNYDPPNYVLAFTERQHLPFKVVLDSTGSIAAAFGQIRLTPTTFLVNRQGKIIFQKIGEPDFEQLEQRIIQALAAK